MLKSIIALIGVVFLLAACDVAHTVKHFEAPLAIYDDDAMTVVYRISFPEMTEYQYNQLQSRRDLSYYQTDTISILSETIDGIDSFDWIDTYFRTNYTVKTNETHCTYAVDLDLHTLCYRDVRKSDTPTQVLIYIEMD